MYGAVLPGSSEVGAGGLVCVAWSGSKGARFRDCGQGLGLGLGEMVRVRVGSWCGAVLPLRASILS